jgi:hypothetical protein
MPKLNQRGVTHLLLLAVVGIIVFILIANAFSFKNNQFSSLFPKTPSHASSSFLETYNYSPRNADGTFTPVPPEAFSNPNWDIMIHSRDKSDWYSMITNNFAHGDMCEPPPATHFIDGVYEKHVFNCRDHLMTAIQADGYGAIVMTPNQMVDFSQGEAVIKWDMSTMTTSGRDWVDLWITPMRESLIMPLAFSIPDGQGEPRNGINIALNTNGGSYDNSGNKNPQNGQWGGKIMTNFVEKTLNNPCCLFWASFLNPDASRRDTFELHISKTHLKFGMPQYNQWWLDQDIDPLTWGEGVVQFAHHSYNPYKDTQPNYSNGPGTWHWDNVSIAPSDPFTFVKANPRLTSSTDANHTFTFSSPVPASSYVRFDAVTGTIIQISFDNGATWREAHEQLSYSLQIPTGSNQAISYWEPIPQGTTTMMVKGTGSWWGGDWYVKDVSVWSHPTLSSTPVPTPTVTSTPFKGSPMAIPGKIEAEDFDNGGQRVAYLDADLAGHGGKYRPGESVDIETSDDTDTSGFKVFWTNPGEWLKYTVNVTQAGAYTLTSRVQNGNPGGAFHIEFNGVDKTGIINVPVSGWVDINKTIALDAGTQVMRVVMDPLQGGYQCCAPGEFNYFTFTKSGAPLPTPLPTPTPTSVPTPTPAGSVTPTPGSKPGDIDGNGKVDIFDYNILLGNFGKTGAGIQGDIDKNGKVDIFDYNILLSNFGK